METNKPWIESILSVITVITFAFDIITFPVYFLLQQPWKKRNLSRRIKAIPFNEDREQITYRSVDPPRALHIKMLQTKIDTLEKMLNYVVKIHTTKRCLGTRQILSEEGELQPNGRVFKKYNMGEYKWKNFIEVERLATCFGRGLRELGHNPKQNISIFAETRAEWLIAAHGCFKQNMPLVTIYATLGDEAIEHGMNETEVETIITSHELLPKFKTILPNLPNVKRIIFMEDQIKKTDTEGFKSDVRIIPFSQVLQMGVESKFENVSPVGDDTAIIMYTSGSTGTPKGVLLSHISCISSIKSFSDMVKIYPNDVLIGFLPLAHVFELIVESFSLLSGVPIGYSNPLTLTDTSSKVMRGCKGDASILKPTCMTSVPLILDRISKDINDKVNSQTPLISALFKYCYNYKVKWVARGYETPLLDKLIFHKIGELLGGNIRLILSGGAPLSPDTHEHIRNCLCTSVIQGYGLTETTSGATVMDVADMECGRVGPPLTMCHIKLINWEEGGYKVTNRPYPQGEILIGGEGVSKGYYKQPLKTKEEFFDEEDGKRWFKTGDIGEFHFDGALKIIDRKKDLVKLQAGEYVSLGKVESELKTCPLIDNICVYADPTKQFTVALIVPNQKHLEDFAAKQGIIGVEHNELCTSPIIVKGVTKELAAHAQKCKLMKFEIPFAVTLCKEVWSPDMGLITAAFKLKRKEIQDKYQNDINRMYSS